MKIKQEAEHPIENKYDQIFNCKTGYYNFAIEDLKRIYISLSPKAVYDLDKIKVP